MNTYQFIASLVQSLVSLGWPIAIVVAVWLFRREIQGMLPRMKVRYGDVDVSFRLEEAEKAAKALTPPPTDAIPILETAEEKSNFEKVADQSPRAAILELRNELEGIMQRFAAAQGVVFSSKRSSMLYLMRVLRSRGKLDATTSALLDDLRVVANAAAHEGDREFALDDARRFKSLFEVVVSRLRGIELGHIKPSPPAEIEGSPAPY